MKELNRIMMSNDDDNNDDDELAGIVFDPVELQTLADETDRLEREQQRLNVDNGEEDDVEQDDNEDDSGEPATGFDAVVKRYRQSRQPFIFDKSSIALEDHPLMEECNAVMQE